MADENLDKRNLTIHIGNDYYELTIKSIDLDTWMPEGICIVFFISSEPWKCVTAYLKVEEVKDLILRLRAILECG